MSPDFLYIGAPRAASTWLWTVLRNQPNIWVPPCKNVAWFHPRFQMYRLKILKHYWRNMFWDNDADIRQWYRRFFFDPFGSEAWYQSLFPDDHIAGDIAESYCSLNEKQIAKIATLNPSMKIIFVMRNPYERALSHARLGVLKRKGKAASFKNFVKHIDHPSSEARSFYSQALARWEKHFPPKQFFIRFYEDVKDDPTIFLSDLCQFLGTDYDDSAYVSEIVNASPPADLSQDISMYTAQKYHDEIKILAERFQGPAQLWLDQVEAIIAE